MKCIHASVLGTFLCLLVSGCATITQGTSETYLVVSEPTGAMVRFSTGETCQTPCEIEKKRNSSFFVNIFKQGYRTQKIEVKNRLSKSAASSVAGNILMVGSVVWLSIDNMSGAMKELAPNPCIVDLEPDEKPSGIKTNSAAAL